MPLLDVRVRHRVIVAADLEEGLCPTHKESHQNPVKLNLQPRALQALAKELVAYLAVTDEAFKGSLTEHLCRVVQRYAPSARWYVDTLLQIMLIAGSYVQVRSCALHTDVGHAWLRWTLGRGRERPTACRTTCAARSSSR